MSRGSISVVIPARDAERYLTEALDSVTSQTRPPTEVIVVDDGSSDRTAAVASGYGGPVRCIGQERGGPAAALNTGIAQAAGELLAFLDADDVWLPAKLERQARVLAENPAIDFVLGHVEHFHSPEMTPEDVARIARPPGPTPGLSKGTMLIRREAFARVGPFATTWRSGEFIDWYARATDAGLQSTMLPEVVMRRRLHRSNSGMRNSDAGRDYLLVVRSVLERRRAQQR